MASSKREILAYRRKSLRKRLKLFRDALKNDQQEEAEFWWAKIHRKIRSIKSICNEVSSMEDMGMHENDLTYPTNIAVVNMTFELIRSIEAELGEVKEKFETVPIEHGQGWLTYKDLLEHVQS